MNQKKTTIGILAACAMSLSYMALSPVIAEIAAAFPDTPVSMVQLIITLPALMFIFFSPLSGKLTQVVKAKKLVLIGTCLYLVGGLLPFFLHDNIWELLAGSVIIGCGNGLMNPLLNVYMVDYYDENARGRLMGFNATFVALGCMLMMFISGQLVRFGWHFSYLTFLLIVPILIILIICLPEGIMHVSADGKKHSGFEMNPYVAFVFIVGIIYFTMQNAFNTNASIYISEIGAGGADVASTVTMANTLGGIVGGMCFGFAAVKCKRQIQAVSLMPSAVGFLLAFFVRSFIPITIGSALVGFAFAWFNASGTLILSKVLKPENNAFTVSVYLAAVNAGAALSPVVVNGISNVIAPDTATRFLVCGIILAVCVVVCAFVNLRNKD